MSKSTSCINSNDKIYLTAVFSSMKGSSSPYITVETVRDSLKQMFQNNSTISQDSSNIIVNKLNSSTSLTDLDSYLDELVDFVNNSCSSSTSSKSNDLSGSAPLSNAKVKRRVADRLSTGSSSTGSSSTGSSSMGGILNPNYESTDIYDITRIGIEKKVLTQIFDQITVNRDYSNISIERYIENIKTTYGFMIDSENNNDEYDSLFGLEVFNNKFLKYYESLVPYDENQELYDSYLRLFNNLFSNVKFKIIINQIYDIIMSDEFKENGERALKKVDNILNTYITDIFSTKEIFSLILFLRVKDDVLNILKVTGEADSILNVIDNSTLQYTTLSDYVEQRSQYINNSKLPKKYLVMITVFLKSFLAMFLQNYDSDSEILSLLSIFTRLSSIGGLENHVIVPVIFKSLFRVFFNTIENVTKTHNIIDNTDGNDDIETKIYNVIVKDNNVVVIDGVKKLLIEQNIKAYIRLIEPNINKISEEDKSNKILDMDMINNDTTLNNELNEINTLITQIQSISSVDEYNNFICTNHSDFIERLENRIRDNKNTLLSKLLVKQDEYSQATTFILSDSSSILTQIYDKLEQIQQVGELKITELNITGDQITGNCPDTGNSNSRSIDSVETFTNNSNMNFNRIINILLVISFIVLIIVGYFYVKKSDNNHFVLTETPTLYID